MQVTAYTQTSSDIEARIGNAAKTAQVQGNFNNLIMLRVRENRTAELLTTQLPQVEIYTKRWSPGTRTRRMSMQTRTSPQAPRTASGR
jgi:hypothetical protein